MSRTRFTCLEPKVVASLVAGTANGRVVSFEHYRYGVVSRTAEIDRADAAILETLRLKPLASACPAAILAAGNANGGACMDPSVLGQAAVLACARDLETQGWTRDDATAGAIGTQTGKTLVCYRRASK